ncbi:MAG: 16S rRNA (adenine(1518)-N(6)/adenine(1519)-N(6))-dimethyltransferase RsmA [bacterium]
MTGSLRRQVLSILQKYKFAPRKKFGQNFLVSNKALDDISIGAALARDDQILEIGTGLGQLTRFLAQRVQAVITLEIDPALFSLLKSELFGVENIRLILTDSARCDYEEIIRHFPEKGQKIKVIGNLPYNAAVPILIHLESIREHISLILVTLQKELAERFRALPGEDAYGALSIRMQYFYEIRKIASLPPEDFFPRPKVHSEIISLLPLQNPPVHLQNEQLFFRLTQAAFSQRRKTLLNALKAQPALGVPQNLWPNLLERADICPHRRGETLSLGEFARLSNVIFHIRSL